MLLGVLKKNQPKTQIISWASVAWNSSCPFYSFLNQLMQIKYEPLPQLNKFVRFIRMIAWR